MPGLINRWGRQLRHRFSDRDATHAVPMAARERALMEFSKQRVWDTEHNNGVLIYLLLTEHAIEIVADRALARCVSSAQWQHIVGTLSADLRNGSYEEALLAAVAQVSLLLIAQFPRTGPAHLLDNELPDAPLVR